MTVKRPPIPKDIKDARKLLDELVFLRKENKDLKKDIGMLNTRCRKAETQLDVLKPRRTATPKKVTR